MSWFDATGLASIAKSALKEAQRTIDKALDIKDDVITTPLNTPIDTNSDDFFNSWGISQSGNIEENVQSETAPQCPNQSKTTVSIWGSFAGSFFDTTKGSKLHGSVESLDDLIDYGNDGFSRSKLVVQQSDDGESGSYSQAPQQSDLKSEILVDTTTTGSVLEEHVASLGKKVQVTNQLSLISDNGKISSESVEIVSGGTGCTTSPESDLHSVDKSISASSSVGLKFSDSVEILASSLTSPSSVEILATESELSYTNEFVSPMASPIVDDKDSVEVIPDVDDNSVAEDSISYASFSESTSNTLLEPSILNVKLPKALNEPITRGPSRNTMHLSLAQINSQLVDVQPQTVKDNAIIENCNIIHIPEDRGLYEIQADDDGSQSDRTVIASDNIMESSSDTSTAEGNTNSFYLKNMLADAMTEKVTAPSFKTEQISISQVETVPRDNSPLSSESRSDLVKIGSDEASGHTSGDENETTTSSDIEIISSPNGDSSSTQSRHSPAKLSSTKTKIVDANVDVLLGKMTYKRMKGHNRELSEASSISDDSHSSEIDRLIKRISEMTEILELREAKLIDFSRRNAELQETNNDLRHQLDVILTKVDSVDLSQVTEEYTQRLSALEKKFQQAIRDKDILRKQLEESKQEAAVRMSKTELESLLLEKEEIINELREEGGKLSKQQLQHSNIIKKLRTKEKEQDATIKNLRENVEDLISETDHLKRSLVAKEEVERSQIEAVHQLTSKNKKLEYEIVHLQGQYDDIFQKYETLKISLDVAKKELIDKNKVTSELYAREQILQSLENEKRIAELQTEEIVNQLEDFRCKLRQADENYIKREQILRQENNELLRRLEDVERRNEGLAQSGLDVTKPIIRQLEALQATHHAKVIAFEKVEQSMCLKINEVQSKLQSTSDAERAAREECLNMRSKLSSFEAQLNTLSRQNEILKIDVEQAKAVKTILEQDLRGQISALQEQVIAESNKNKSFQNEIAALEQQLSIERTANEAEKRKNLNLQDQLRERTESLQGYSKSSPNNTRNTSPTMSVGRVSLSESLGSIIWPGEDLPDLSPAPRFTNMYELQMLQSNLKQKEGEVQQMQWELNRREQEKNLLSVELSKLLTRVEQLEETSKKYEHLKAEFIQVQQQYDTLCQLYGEKVEETDELKLDLLDVKELYKAQLDELLQQQKT